MPQASNDVTHHQSCHKPLKMSHIISHATSLQRCHTPSIMQQASNDVTHHQSCHKPLISLITENLLKFQTNPTVEPNHNMCPWSTMECSQPAAWTSNRSLLAVFGANTYPGRQTNFGSTLPRAAHLEGGEIWCHRRLHLTLDKCSGISRHAANPSCLPTTTSIPTPTHRSYD